MIMLTDYHDDQFYHEWQGALSVSFRGRQPHYEEDIREIGDELCNRWWVVLLGFEAKDGRFIQNGETLHKAPD